jgi:hypothetical protein
VQCSAVQCSAVQCSAVHSGIVNCSLSKETRLLLLGPWGPRARLPPAAGPPAPASSCSMHMHMHMHMESLPRRQTLARRRQASPQTLEAVPNASFECQTVYLLLKIILDPKEFLYAGSSTGSMNFYFFLHRYS